MARRELLELCRNLALLRFDDRPRGLRLATNLLDGLFETGGASPFGLGGGLRRFKLAFESGAFGLLLFEALLHRLDLALRAGRVAGGRVDDATLLFQLGLRFVQRLAQLRHGALFGFQRRFRLTARRSGRALTVPLCVVYHLPHGGVHLFGGHARQVANQRFERGVLAGIRQRLFERAQPRRHRRAEGFDLLRHSLFGTLFHNCDLI